jgi:hypothetical protein
LPLLHINHVLALDQNSAGFMYLKNKFKSKKGHLLDSSKTAGTGHKICWTAVRQPVQDTKFVGQQ